MICVSTGHRTARDGTYLVDDSVVQPDRQSPTRVDLVLSDLHRLHATFHLAPLSHHSSSDSYPLTTPSQCIRTPSGAPSALARLGNAILSKQTAYKFGNGRWESFQQIVYRY